MKNRNFWIGLLIGFILNQIIIYSAYYVFIFIPFGLGRDSQRYWMQEIIERRILQADGISVYNPRRLTPGRGAGCSILIFEHLWRECKEIYLQSTANPTKGKNMEIVVSTITNPCRWLDVLPAGRRVDAVRDLECEQGSGPYQVTVFFRPNEGGLSTIGKFEGRAIN